MSPHKDAYAEIVALVRQRRDEMTAEQRQELADKLALILTHTHDWSEWEPSHYTQDQVRYCHICGDREYD